MPKLNPKSESRAMAIKHYYSPFMKEIKDHIQYDKPFLVKDIWYLITCIKHLSDSYAYDISVSICTQAVEDGKLIKRGKFYILEKVKAHA